MIGLFDVWEAAVELLAPAECAACDFDVVNDLGLCAPCTASLRTTRGAMRVLGVPMIAPVAYAGAIVQAIARFKYSARPDLARPLARIVSRALDAAGVVDGKKNHPVCFVPVPLHPRRLAERGYNQSALLARQIARTAGARTGALLLRRTRDTAQQATLRGGARTENVAGAFAVRGWVRGGRLVLVDDVITTGATAAQCILALRTAGHDVAAVVAIARSGRP